MFLKVEKLANMCLTFYTDSVWSYVLCIMQSVAQVYTDTACEIDGGREKVCKGAICVLNLLILGGLRCIPARFFFLLTLKQGVRSLKKLTIVFSTLPQKANMSHRQKGHYLNC